MAARKRKQKAAARAYRMSKAIKFGAIGGLAGGALMLVAMFGLISMLGISLPATPGFDMTTFMAAHFMVSAAIGAIFGVIVSKVRVFRITSVGRGVMRGIVTGLIAMGVLGVPFFMSSMQTFVMSLFLASTAWHIVYGAVLGVIVGYGLRRK